MFLSAVVYPAWLQQLILTSFYPYYYFEKIPHSHRKKRAYLVFILFPSSSSDLGDLLLAPTFDLGWNMDLLLSISVSISELSQTGYQRTMVFSAKLFPLPLCLRRQIGRNWHHSWPRMLFNLVKLAAFPYTFPSRLLSHSSLLRSMSFTSKTIPSSSFSFILNFENLLTVSPSILW